MNILDSLCALDGIASAGVCDFEALAPFWEEKARGQARALCPQARSVFVALFPYFAGRAPGNLSLYARGRDYHAVIEHTLAPFAAALRAQGAAAVVLADASPLPETQAARLSGAGRLGENGLIFDPDYGSYVFIGTVLTDLPFAPAAAVHRFAPPTPPPDAAARPLQCRHCGSCRLVCPLGALHKDGRVDPLRCLSALTQRGGTLPPDAARAVARHPLIWGCDLCQTICPQNRFVRESDTPAFWDHPIPSLSLPDVDGLTRRAFAAKYPARAFTWRGPGPLVRNLTLQKEEHP